MHSADSTKRIGQVVAFPQTARVIPFPSAARALQTSHDARFSMRDRMAAHSWMDSVRDRGFTRLVFEAAGDFGDNETGEFILIYERNASWASWGIGCSDTGMSLWRSSCGTTVGTFATLNEALAALSSVTSKAPPRCA